MNAKIKEIMDDCNNLPRLKGLEFRYLRFEMNQTQNELVKISRRSSKSIISRFETANNGQNIVKTYWIALLRDSDPELFWEAYCRWLDKPLSQRKTIIEELFNKVWNGFEVGNLS